MNLKSNSPLPKASIVVPAYNNGEYIGEALDSVIAQTYSNWECIVVDDGSTDNTREIVAEYCQKESRISYLYQENAGPSLARNNGIAHTSGEFILPLDADDKIADTYLEKAISYFEAHPETTLVYCRVAHFGNLEGEWKLPQYRYEDIIYGNCIFCTAMFKRSDYLQTSGYNPNMRHGYEDWDFWLTLLNTKSIVHQIDEILFFYRVKQISRSTTLSDSYHNETYLQLVNNHPELFNLEGMFEWRQLQKELERIRKSKAYRLGKFLLRPISRIRNTFSS